MKVLVDTSVWSLALRKSDKNDSEKYIVEILSGLVRDTNVVSIGNIRQEILSGISSYSKYEELKEKIAIFKDTQISTGDYEAAAAYFNTCRKNGIQGSHIDYLICAVAVANDFTIFSLDMDFIQYKKHLPIKLLKIESV